MPIETTPIKGTTRIAPSPTGALHLGNTYAFMINWAIARQRQLRIHLRIEDLDTPRVKPGVIEQTIDTLSWIGIDWDTGPEIQSGQLDHHRSAMDQLAMQRVIYPCALTRAQIASAASAPNEGDHETRFDPSLRPGAVPDAFDDAQTNWRLIVEPGGVGFDDGLLGPRSIDVHGSTGDFVVWTKRGCPSYQLAVVVDDAAMGITDIVRGNDLVDSTGRQILLMRALGIENVPRYIHLPLVRGQDGRRLAKRHGDTRVDSYRHAGVPNERIIGLIAWWCGIIPERAPMSAGAFCDQFDLDAIPRTDRVFTPEDDLWLRNTR